MDLKFFYKILLIFNIVVVYSISCKNIVAHGTHKLGKYTIHVGRVSRIFPYHGGTLYKFSKTFLDYYDGYEKVEVRACITQFNRVSYLEFDNSSSYRDTGNVGLYLDETSPSFHSPLYFTDI